MNNVAKQRADMWTDPAARIYLAFGLVAAFILGLSLMQYAEGIWAVVPTLIAIAGLMFRWLSAPVFVLLGVALALLVTQPRFAVEPAPLNDALLAASVVAVMLAHFRLYSIANAILPHDPRRLLDPAKPRRQGPPVWVEILMVLTIVPYIVHLIRRRQPTRYQLAPTEKRASPVAVDEWPRAVGVVAIAATTSVAIWTATALMPPPELTIPEQWRLGLMVWFTLVPVFLVTVVVSYRHARRRSPTEARLILVDELWRETRGEQRRTVRWINWARLKQQYQSREKLS
jgi:hypothetical protein